MLRVCQKQCFTMWPAVFNFSSLTVSVASFFLYVAVLGVKNLGQDNVD